MITLAITHYNRYQLLVESFREVLNDDRITEILIMDDDSDRAILHKVLRLAGGKVNVIKQGRNRGMLVNKHDAIASAKNDWVIIFDSDNIIRENYLDAIAGAVYQGWAQPYVFYAPSFAEPSFDYRHLNMMMFTKKTIKLMESSRGPVIADPMFWCMLNTCNMMVHKETYCKVFEDNKSVKESDTLWMNYLWLKAGNTIMVVPDMHYFHRVHPGSGWLKNANYNTQKGEEIKQLILNL